MRTHTAEYAMMWTQMRMTRRTWRLRAVVGGPGVGAAAAQLLLARWAQWDADRGRAPGGARTRRAGTPAVVVNVKRSLRGSEYVTKAPRLRRGRLQRTAAAGGQAGRPPATRGPVGTRTAYVRPYEHAGRGSGGCAARWGPSTCLSVSELTAAAGRQPGIKAPPTTGQVSLRPCGAARAVLVGGKASAICVTLEVCRGASKTRETRSHSLAFNQARLYRNIAGGRARACQSRRLTGAGDFSFAPRRV